MLFSNITIDFLNGDCQKTEHKIAFIHIPKTGGTSIEYVLQKARGSAHERHYNVRQMQKVLKNQDIKKYKIFTIIRNPFDRIISTWRWWAYHTAKMEFGARASGWCCEWGESFQEYVLTIKEYFDGNADKGNGVIRVDPEQPSLTLTHIEKLDWWLTKDDGSLVECDFLRFEDLNNEWEKYKKELGVKARLSHKNASLQIPITKSRAKLCDDETYKIISEIYKDEIEMFNYE